MINSLNRNNEKPQNLKPPLPAISDINWYSLFAIKSVLLPKHQGVYEARTCPGIFLTQDESQYVEGTFLVDKLDELPVELSSLNYFNGIPLVIAFFSCDITKETHPKFFQYPNCISIVNNNKSNLSYIEPNKEIYYRGKTFISLENAAYVVWKYFKMNLPSLRIFADALCINASTGIMQKDLIRVDLRKKIFGIKPEDCCPFMDDKMLVIMNLSDEKQIHGLEEYIPLFDFMHLIALLQGIEDGDVKHEGTKLKLPSSECGIMLKNENCFNLLYFDDKKIVPCYNKEIEINNAIIEPYKKRMLSICRFRQEIQTVRQKKLSCIEDMRRETENQKATSEEINERFNHFDNEELNLQQKIASLYFDVTKKFWSIKEDILKDQTELQKIDIQIKNNQETMKDKKVTRIVSNLQNILPLMSVLPARVKTEVTLGKDSVIINRPKNAKDIYDFELEISPDNEDKEYNLNILLSSTNKVFKELNCEWLLAVGYVGLCHLYGDRKKFGSKEFLETGPADFWKTLRPNSIEKIEKQGLRDILDNKKADDPSKLSPIQLFKTLMHVLRGVKFPYVDAKEGKEKWILGLIEAVFIPSTDSFEWKFSTRLEKIITEQNQYMISNHDAMFSYKGWLLHTAPALQLYNESLIRNNLYKGLFTSKNSCLITPQGDGIKIETIAKAIGLFVSKDLREKDLIKKIYSSLDACAEFNGGIESWEKQQKNKKDSLETKLILKAPEAYKLVYESAELEQLKNKLANKVKYPLKYLT